MNVVSAIIPKNSLIEKSFETIHYIDSFNVEFNSTKEIDLSFCVSQCLLFKPKWLNLLLIIRKALVKPFGLKTSNTKHNNKKIIQFLNIAKGANIEFFEVVDYLENEVLLLAKDSHLNVCLSFILYKTHYCYSLTLTTTVHYNNTLGKIYFFFVKPFHKIIVASMLHRLVKNISN